MSIRRTDHKTTTPAPVTTAERRRRVAVATFGAATAVFQLAALVSLAWWALNGEYQSHPALTALTAASGLVAVAARVAVARTAPKRPARRRVPSAFQRQRA
jgi:hypothetical protein